MEKSSQNFSGLVPEISMKADCTAPRSESSVGALIPWANKLWAVTYVGLPYTDHGGSGTGLFEIDEDMNLTKRSESIVGTFANRLMHTQTDQIIIGPHIIDHKGSVRTFTGIHKRGPETANRLTATVDHVENPEEQVYFVTMRGQVYEANVSTLEYREVVDITEGKENWRGHFKGAFTHDGKVFISSNGYNEDNYLNESDETGGLFAWDPVSDTVEIISDEPHMDINSTRPWVGGRLFTTGWDKKSAFLDMRSDGDWRRYRLPKGSTSYDHGAFGEWTRIRSVDHERFLIDCHGLFYELNPTAWGGHIRGLEPICRHLRVIPDFCSYQGMLVLGGNQITQERDSNAIVGQPQSGIWFGKTDDLWNFGDPKGTGAVWFDEKIAADTPSDPILLYGFSSKSLHLSHEENDSVSFTIEVDVRGTDTWNVYDEVEVSKGGYKSYNFPAGFECRWARLRADTDCLASAEFMLG